MYLKQPAWGNAAGGHGRRITEEDLVEKVQALEPYRRSDSPRSRKADFARNLLYSQAGSIPGHAMIRSGVKHGSGKRIVTGLGVGLAGGVGGAGGALMHNSSIRRSRHQREDAVEKAYYDPEARRQRAYGASEAGLGLTGAGAVAAGGRQIKRDTMKLRENARPALEGHDPNPPRSDGLPDVGPARDKAFASHSEAVKESGKKYARAELKGAVRLRRKPVALAGAGAAALYGANKINRHSESERGKRWD